MLRVSKRSLSSKGSASPGRLPNPNNRRSRPAGQRHGSGRDKQERSSREGGHALDPRHPPILRAGYSLQKLQAGRSTILAAASVQNARRYRASVSTSACSRTG